MLDALDLLPPLLHYNLTYPIRRLFRTRKGLLPWMRYPDLFLTREAYLISNRWSLLLEGASDPGLERVDT